MKLLDRIWLAGNKKKPSRSEYYLGMVIFSFVFGVLFAASFVVFSSNTPWLAYVLILLIVVFFLWSTYLDYKKGYVDVIHKRSVEFWEERKKKLGVK